MASSVTIEGSSTTTTETRTLGAITITGTSAVDTSIVLTLASGDNTVVVPTGSVGVVVVPTSLSGTVKYRTNQNNSDTGLTISNTLPFVKTFPSSPPTSIILNSSTLQTSTIELWFW